MSVTDSFTHQLIKESTSNRKIIVLDADLSDDLNLKKFQKKFPKRFIQNGIAEQDMVSMAGGLALSGLLPIVNSFASFLTARANEQIYNNATEYTKIIYISLYSGLIPAGAGKSHQSLRDISLLSSIPNMSIFHPLNEMETKQILKHCIKNEKKNCAIRLSIGPAPHQAPKLPKKYKFSKGKGSILAKGNDALIFAYGQTMINEAFKAHKLLLSQGIKTTIINLPTINYFENTWLKKTLKISKNIFVIDDHNFSGGLGDLLISFIQEKKLGNFNYNKIAIKNFPACGTVDEVLKFHKLDHKSISKFIKQNI
jgi:transketolase